MLALGIIIPVLPKLVLDFVGGDAVRGADYLGLFGTAWALMQFLFSPIHGALSDRFGRRPVILLVEFRARPRLHPDGAGADAGVAVRRPHHLRHHRGEHLDRLCLCRRRRRAGQARARCSACSASPSAPASCSARRSAASPAAIDPRLPFWIAAGLSLLNGVYGLLILPESLPPEKRAPFNWRRANPIGSLIAAALASAAARARGGRASSAISRMSSLPNIGVLYMMYRYGWDEQHRRLRDGAASGSAR